MNMELVIFEAIKSVLKLKDDDFNWTLSPFGLVVRINRTYNDRKLKNIIIDKDHKEICILYEESASAYDIEALTKFGGYQVSPIKHIGENDNPDSYYLDTEFEGICLKMNYK